jgi:hypothetical protein
MPQGSRLFLLLVVFAPSWLAACTSCLFTPEQLKDGAYMPSLFDSPSEEDLALFRSRAAMEAAYAPTQSSKNIVPQFQEPMLNNQLLYSSTGDHFEAPVFE